MEAMPVKNTHRTATVESIADMATNGVLAVAANDISETKRNVADAASNQPVTLKRLHDQ